MDFDRVLRERHSVRAYSSREVPHDVLERVLDAASFAPSSFNEQPWRFFVATGETRTRVGEIMAQSTVYLEDYMEVLGPEGYERATKWYTDLGGCPVVVAVSMTVAEDTLTHLNRMLSVGAAVQNVLLAVTNEGLGACSITFSFWLRDELSRELGVPEDREIVALIAMGYPAEQPLAPPHSHDIAVFRD